jgi:PPOX class probable FMN-dependent enzyme
VRVHDDQTLLIPDSPGNNRLDSFENILSSGRVGLLFLVPGVDETLRVNGNAALVDDAATLGLFASASRPPKSVIRVTVLEAYLHCAKALMRSRLWDPASRVERSTLPSMGEMLRDQAGSTGPAETQAEMVERYKAQL